MRVTSRWVTSRWHQLEKGIVTLCTISVSLSALAMSMVVKAAEVECRGPIARSGMQLHLIRGYMDDLIVIASSVPGSRWIALEDWRGLSGWMRWASSLLNLLNRDNKRDRVSDMFHFTLEDTTIPSSIENQSRVWENSWRKPQRRDNHPDIHQDLAQQNGQVRNARNIQVLDLPTWHPAPNSAGFWSFPSPQHNKAQCKERR